jgi:PilZ domain
MFETRAAPRYRMIKRATIVYGTHKHPCTVRDISRTGAALDFSDPIRVTDIPCTFTLVLPEGQLKLSCRVIWHGDYRMGVVFN